MRRFQVSPCAVNLISWSKNRWIGSQSRIPISTALSRAFAAAIIFHWVSQNRELKNRYYHYFERQFVSLIDPELFQYLCVPRIPLNKTQLPNVDRTPCESTVLDRGGNRILKNRGGPPILIPWYFDSKNSQGLYMDPKTPSFCYTISTTMSGPMSRFFW